MGGDPYACDTGARVCVAIPVAYVCFENSRQGRIQDFGKGRGGGGV